MQFWVPKEFFSSANVRFWKEPTQWTIRTKWYGISHNNEVITLPPKGGQSRFQKEKQATGCAHALLEHRGSLNVKGKEPFVNSLLNQEAELLKA